MNRFVLWDLFCHDQGIGVREPILFWAKAWRRGEIGIWEDWGETSLTFLEYLLVGVAADLFPNDLLNTDGVNRR